MYRTVEDRIRDRLYGRSERGRNLQEREQVLDECAERVLEHYADVIADRRVSGNDNPVVQIVYQVGRHHKQLFVPVGEHNKKSIAAPAAKPSEHIRDDDVLERIRLHGLACRPQFQRDYSTPRGDVMRFVCGESAVRRFWVWMRGD